MKSLRAAKEAALIESSPDGGRCELCRKVAQHLQKTECCGRMVCVRLLSDGLFVSKGSCSVKHSRFTLCGAHHTERHSGDWQTCEICRETWEPEMYVWYGTNKWNIEKLPNPPPYEPTHCAGCGRVIVLSRDAYSHGLDGYRCQECW